MPITKAAVKLTAKPAAKAASKQGVLSGYESIVDQLAELEVIISPAVLTALKKQKRLEEELRAIADKEVAADAPATISGTTHDFTVTERGEQRAVDVKEVRKAMGDKLFFEVARVNLSDVDKYLSAAEQASCISVSRSGYRKGKLIKK